MNIKQPNIEHYYKILDILFNAMPYIFWKDRSGKYQGANSNQARNLGFSSPEDFIGKTIYQILEDHKAAQSIDKFDNKIMRDDITIIKEEKIEIEGREKYYLSQKSPIHDEAGNVIGMIGFSMDITEIKQNEEEIKYHLKETEEREKAILFAKTEAQTRIEEQEKFVNIANQVAHDIRSPLSSLLMIVKSCKDIPEQYRIALREAAISIGDIANHLLSQYQNQDAVSDKESEISQAMLTSAILLELLTEKKYQYSNLPVKFDYDFTQESYFAFIKIQKSAFKRMISNIINNAVDAYDGKPGKIDLKLRTDNEWLTIIIQDNGKGIPPEIVEKILQNIAITSGKKDGHGIGLTQVRETLQQYQGEMHIQSQLGKGTQIILTFPRIKSPNWIAEQIEIGSEDIIIILDDDVSIHGAWNTHFDPILKKYPSIQLKHFELAEETLKFVESMPPSDKKKIFLLTDFELLKQELTGLHVVAKTQITRSILVTSHYANKSILEQAAATNTKILPKQLASEVPIWVNEKTNGDIAGTAQVDLVIVDDDKGYVENLATFVLFDKTIAFFEHPQNFLDNLSNYSKDTKIFLDNNFDSKVISGIELAKHLHEQGYKRLYLLSGQVFREKELPPYLMAIRKDDLDAIKKLTG